VTSTTDGPTNLTPDPDRHTRDAEPQDVEAPLSLAAGFLVVSIANGAESVRTVRSVVGGVDDLIKDVRSRTSGVFSCNVGISYRSWEQITGEKPPAEHRSFQEIRGPKHTAVATPGDLLFHIRAARTDLIVQFEKLLLTALGGAVTVEDEVSGFRYFDGRDLLGFVDGTANPIGLDLPAATLVGQEDQAHAGGSYVVVQKYLHDLTAWEEVGADDQETIIGRTKLDNVELDDARADQQKSHKTLCTIEDEQGEHDILRDNMPFAHPGRGEYGTYFIGYSRHLWVIEKMLERMFLGDPPGMHDRILDFSRPTTGVTFFVPPRRILAGLDQ
jgi:putative iron-dependent peroxidase